MINNAEGKEIYHFSAVGRQCYSAAGSGSFLNHRRPVAGGSVSKALWGHSLCPWAKRLPRLTIYAIETCH